MKILILTLMTLGSTCAYAVEPQTSNNEKMANLQCVQITDPVTMLGREFKWLCPKDGKKFADNGFCNRWCNSTGRGG
jgi:hypothetical protein